MPIVKVALKGYGAVKAKAEKIGAQSEAAVKRTISDMRSRAPGAIASCVTGTYNIKKSEVNPTSTKAGKKAVSIRVSGETIEGLSFTYSGRRLTPSHFGMTPKNPPAGKSYTLKATIRKDNGPQVIGRYSKARTPDGPYSAQSPFVLMSTGNTKVDGTDFIPFQRQAPGHRPTEGVQKFLTTSVPQMVGDETVSNAIQTKLTELLSKRFEYHMSKVGR